MMFRSWMILLCFRLCRSAVGAPSGSPVRKIAVPGTRCGGLASSRLTRSLSGTSMRRAFSARIAVPRRQVSIISTSAPPKRIGIQPPCAIFRLLAARKVERDEDERAERRDRRPAPPVPAIAEHDDGEQRVDHHRRRDGDAVGGGEIGRAAEEQRQHDDGGEEQPVDARNVDLAGRRLRGEEDAHARQQAELDRLPRQRIGAADHRLAGDHGRGGGEDDDRDERPFGKEQEERVLARRGVAEHQRALAEIVQHRARERRRSTRPPGWACGRNGRDRRRAPPRLSPPGTPRRASRRR